jgi:hypothetical protein
MTVRLAVNVGCTCHYHLALILMCSLGMCWTHCIIGSSGPCLPGLYMELQVRTLWHAGSALRAFSGALQDGVALCLLPVPDMRLPLVGALSLFNPVLWE